MAIRYQFVTPHPDAAPPGPRILARPSCGSLDVLCEKRPAQLPLDVVCI